MINIKTDVSGGARELLEKAITSALEKRAGEWNVEVRSDSEQPHWQVTIDGPVSVEFPLLWAGSAEDEQGRIEQAIRTNVARALGEEHSAL